MTSVLVARGDKQATEVVEFGDVPGPGELLARLVEWHRRGLTGPLRFAPAAARAFARALVKGKARGASLESARTAYEAEDLPRGPHLRRAFGRSTPPFDDVAGAVGDFETIVTDVLVPLVRAKEDA
jgi:hypothetical protein